MNGTCTNFDKQNFDKLIICFIGEEKVSREKFNELLAIHQNFPLSKFVLCGI